MSEIFIPLAFFAMVVGIVLISVWGNVQSRREANETIRRAIDSGQQLNAETLSSLNKPVRSPQADMRGGIIMIFLGCGLAVGGLVAGGVFGGGFNSESAAGMFIAAAIVGFIGVGQFLAGLMRSKKDS